MHVVLTSGAAHRHHSVALLQKAFTLWVARWQRQTELSQFEDLITFKGNVAVARRAFIMWKHCIQCCILFKHVSTLIDEVFARFFFCGLWHSCPEIRRMLNFDKRLEVFC